MRVGLSTDRADLSRGGVPDCLSVGGRTDVLCQEMTVGEHAAPDLATSNAEEGG